MAHSTYFGSAPVPFQDYLRAAKAQSVKRERFTATKLRKALGDLTINDVTFSRLGRALTAGRALFLYGPPGNGKTSIAERLTRSFGQYVWIPRAINIEGDIVRLYDPIVHDEVSMAELAQADMVDQRWVLIRRPTVVVGGELTMENLEMTFNKTIGVLDAPVQLKSNCGTLVIDDFGRQRMRPDELLNRWIVPLEKEYDFLNLPSGKKVRMPFDQLLVFSTNLDPAQLVDEAFLRRIPYKIQITDPTEEEYRELMRTMAQKYGIAYCDSAVDDLIDRHYRQTGRPLRFCHPRDLLLQIRYLCEFHELVSEMSPQNFDAAAGTYFADISPSGNGHQATNAEGNGHGPR
jgi:predicted ATPase with chaperone activity